MIVLTFGGVATADLQEPKSDPTFNDSHPNTGKDEIDDASDVQLKRTEGPVDTDVATDDITPPERHVVTKTNATPAPGFSVTRVRIDNKKTKPKVIVLLTPAHNTIYTPGVITFSWKYAITSKKKAAVILKVERLDGKKKYAKKVFKEKKLLDLSPGAYKWQVTTVKPGGDSRWRIFKVEDTKSHSLTELYKGVTPKRIAKPTKPEVTAYINEVPDPDEQADVDADPADEIQADDATPLEVPESLRRTPATTKPQDLSAPDWVKIH